MVITKVMLRGSAVFEIDHNALNSTDNGSSINGRTFLATDPT